VNILFISSNNYLWYKFTFKAIKKPIYAVVSCIIFLWFGKVYQWFAFFGFLFFFNSFGMFGECGDEVKDTESSEKSIDQWFWPWKWNFLYSFTVPCPSASVLKFVHILSLGRRSWEKKNEREIVFWKYNSLFHNTEWTWTLECIDDSGVLAHVFKV
jgi:hypothetical protein